MNPIRSEIPLLKGERWWGGAGGDGERQPYGADDSPRVDLRTAGFTSSPLLVSSRGRYVWSERPFGYEFRGGRLLLDSDAEQIAPVRAGETLRDAYQKGADTPKPEPQEGKVVEYAGYELGETDHLWHKQWTLVDVPPFQFTPARGGRHMTDDGHAVA